MIKDRRHKKRYIPIDFFPKETFSDYPSAEHLTLTLITDGSWEFFLNNTEYRIKAPFILCLSTEDKFEVINQYRAAAKTFVFHPTFLNSSLTLEALREDAFENIEDMHDRNILQSFLVRNETYHGFFALDAFSSLQINTSLSIIGSECLSQSDGMWTCRIRRYLLQILYLLEDSFLQNYGKKTSDKLPIDYALEYIHSNYHLGITLNSISKYVGLNRTTLNNQCKTKTGMTIIQYLNHYRIKMAEEALTHTNLSLNEIATCCGYNYDSYFIKIFSEKHSITPTEYRKKKWEADK